MDYMKQALLQKLEEMKEIVANCSPEDGGEMMEMAEAEEPEEKGIGAEKAPKLDMKEHLSKGPFGKKLGNIGKY